MKLEALLKPVKYLDENVILRQYTKLGKKINIDEGKKKYVVASGLWLASYPMNLLSNLNLFGGGFDMASYFILKLNDLSYNIAGMKGAFKENNDSEERAIDPRKEFSSKYNSYARLPTFLFGVGLIGKFGVDLVNSIKNKTSLGADSCYALLGGLGYLSLASSMYLKETDPKLLKKVPLWKRAYETIKEGIKSLAPSPIPVPVPTFSFQENQ